MFLYFSRFTFIQIYILFNLYSIRSFIYPQMANLYLHIENYNFYEIKN